MNKQRRKALEDTKQKIEDVLEELKILQQEEQDYYDNMPEGIQAGEKGDISQTAIDEMESAISSLEDAISNIETAVE